MIRIVMFSVLQTLGELSMYMTTLYLSFYNFSCGIKEKCTIGWVHGFLVYIVCDSGL